MLLGYSIFFLFLRSDAGFRDERKARLYYLLAVLASLILVGKGISERLQFGEVAENTIYLVNVVVQLFVIAFIIKGRRQ